MAVLEIRDLHLEFVARHGNVPVLHGIDLSLERRQILGLVGESGSGKSVTGMSVSRLIDSPPARYTRGSIQVGDVDVLSASEAVLRRMRGVHVGVVFQDPSSNFNPVFTIAQQMQDVALHVARVAPERLGLTAQSGRRARQKRAFEASVEMLDRVGIPDPGRRIHSYPHQFSGGMRQRALIAMALLGRPEVLIADEPTTALDVTVQAQVLELLWHIVDEFDLALLMITHNIGVVAQLCSDVAVMSQGRIVETGDVRSILSAPSDPYTQMLLRAVPRVRSPGARTPPAPALTGRGR